MLPERDGQGRQNNAFGARLGKRVVPLVALSAGMQHLQAWQNSKLAPPQGHQQFNSSPVLDCRYDVVQPRSYRNWRIGKTELIKCYGEFWNPDIVDWGTQGKGNKGTLIGKIKPSNKHIDFWESRGIHVLHDNFKTICVGKAIKSALGKRLRDHLSDRLAGRWDMFSRFSVSAVRTKRKKGRQQTCATTSQTRYSN